MLTKLLDVNAAMNFAAYLGMGIAMLLIFTRVYMFATPYDDREAIRMGKVAPAIGLSGAMLGFVIPLAMASYVGAGKLDFALWAVITGVLQIACYLVMSWLMPRKLEMNNSAGAMIYATAAVCVGIINAVSIIPGAAAH